ncbi:23 kDa integral membrane protein-like [Centruroides sculpturatus]|uniref:23 kDa integral membrane protein-like n=1 Tax=Centruroides sculpturatus TaxID=218467 RepID=UPI000C6E6001|nr:23 kDa integral membrane protein-like [Centruroides sculpturatus]
MIVKFILFANNIITLVFGIIVTITGVWILKDPQVMKLFIDEPLKSIELLRIASYLIIIVGLTAFFIGFLGCCGVCLESLLLLCCFASSLFFPLILCVIVISMTMYLTGKKIKYTVEKQLLGYLLNTKFFTSIEFLFKCCGVTGELDYKGNITMSCRVNKVEIKHPKGCLDKLSEILQDKAQIVYGMTTTIAILIVISIALAFYIRRRT